MRLPPLTQAEAQYNVRAALPDHVATLSRWARESELVRQQLAASVQLDLAYGPSEAERIDLFTPTTAGPHPLVAFLHGGYWQALDKSDHSFIAPAFVDAGVAVAVVNYGLCPETTMEEIVSQARRSIVWLWRESEQLGLDRSCFQVAGHSAGAHLALHAHTTDWPKYATENGDAPDELPPCVFNSLIGISGVYDIRPLTQTSINEKLGLDADRAAALSILSQRPLNRARTLLAVGQHESAAFHAQSDGLRDMWEMADAGIVVMTLFGRDHLSAVEAYAEADHPLHQRALELLKGR